MFFLIDANIIVRYVFIMFNYHRVDSFFFTEYSLYDDMPNRTLFIKKFWYAHAKKKKLLSIYTRTVVKKKHLPNLNTINFTNEQTVDHRTCMYYLIMIH